MRLTVATLLFPAMITAQRPLADRIAAVGTGTVAFSAHTRENICGDGLSSFFDGLGSPRSRMYNGMLLTHGPWDNRIPPCEHGPMRITVRVVDHVPSALRIVVAPVASPADSVTDLGLVSAGEAAAFLTGLARHGDGRASESALLPLVMLDSTPRWTILAAAARDTTRLLRYRRRASDLLARAAASAMGVDQLDDDDESVQRREVVSALARRQDKEDDPVPRLIDMVRNNAHREVRSAALYQLGQLADSRGIALFEELLRGRP